MILDATTIVYIGCFSILASTGSFSNIQQQQQQQQQPGYHAIEMRSNQKTEVIRSRHRHITLMLLAVAVVFLLLTLPNSIYFVLDLTYGFNKAPVDNDYHQWLRYRRLTILTVIMFQLSDLQHATNFFLYLLTSDKFRRTIMMIYATIGHFLSSFLPCTSQYKSDSSSSSLQNHSINQRQEKHKTTSFRSSESDMSRVSINLRYVANRSTPRDQLQRSSYTARMSTRSQTTE
jgi:hypothetical protein